jgi:hypothetical protein
MKAALFIMVMPLLITACANPTASTAKPDSLVLRPGQLHEDCKPLKAGEQVRWQFVATGPIDFNVHYHQGKEVTYPIERIQVQDGAGTYTAPSAQEYCWMWTNRSPRDVVLRAKFER